MDAETASPATIPVPNNDVIDKAADNLDPGINPPGGIGGGGGGELPLVVVAVSGGSLLCCCIAGCCTVSATYFPAEKFNITRNYDAFSTWSHGYAYLPDIFLFFI